MPKGRFLQTHMGTRNPISPGFNKFMYIISKISLKRTGPSCKVELLIDTFCLSPTCTPIVPWNLQILCFMVGIYKFQPSGVTFSALRIHEFREIWNFKFVDTRLRGRIGNFTRTTFVEFKNSTNMNSMNSSKEKNSWKSWIFKAERVTLHGWDLWISPMKQEISKS